jgi:hypothetical protein
MARLDFRSWQKTVTANCLSLRLAVCLGQIFAWVRAIASNFATRLKRGGILPHFVDRRKIARIANQIAGARVFSAIDKFEPEFGAIDFRLYVDGDFTGVGDIAFWMETLTARPWLITYGYSKSWQSFIDYKGIVPSNYRLNLSSGSKYSDSVKDKLKRSTMCEANSWRYL